MESCHIFTDFFFIHSQFSMVYFISTGDNESAKDIKAIKKVNYCFLQNESWPAQW